MSGPERPREHRGRERADDEGEPSAPRPPGEFLTDDLASATARFLDDVKRRIRREAEAERRPRRPPG